MFRRPVNRLAPPAIRIADRPATLDYAPPCDTGNGEGDGTKVADLEHSTGFIRLDLFATSAAIYRGDELIGGRNEGRDED